jgi:hypothetical protein
LPRPTHEERRQQAENTDLQRTTRFKMGMGGEDRISSKARCDDHGDASELEVRSRTSLFVLAPQTEDAPPINTICVTRDLDE